MTQPVFGEVYRTEFPFSDVKGSKERPTVIISSPAYHTHKDDAIILALTTKPYRLAGSHEAALQDLEAAGLKQATYLKASVTTVKRNRLIERLGLLTEKDQQSLRLLLDLTFDFHIKH